MTVSEIAPPAATAGLVDALTARGWAHTGPLRTEPQWRSVCQTLQGPDGRLNLDAAVFPGGNQTITLSAEAVRDGDGRALTPAWTIDLSDWPHEKVLAVIDAAGDDPNLQDALNQAGWQQLPDICEAGRLLERAWTNPEHTAALFWTPGEEHDTGGWVVTRGRLQAAASQDTPPSIITSLALGTRVDNDPSD